MTLIVGIRLDEFSILASDKREVTLVNDTVKQITSDHINKIVDWGEGFISGSGYVPILSALKKKLSDATISSTDDILELAKIASTTAIDNIISKKEKEYWMNRTHWYVTYRAMGSHDSIEPRITIFCANTEKVRSVSNMNVVFSNSFNESDFLRDSLSSQLKPASQFETTQDNLNFHLGLLPEVFSRANLALETVSKEFDVAVQFNDGTHFKSWE